MKAAHEPSGPYGLMAEFEHPEELVKAAHRAFTAGYRKMEGYSPLPIDGLSEALGYKRHFVSLVVLCGESEVTPVVNTGTLYS